MTYVERKHKIKFFFDENNRCDHEQPFGCCGYHNYCVKEGFCIIPESYSDSKTYCQMARKMKWDKRTVIKITEKKANFKRYDEGWKKYGKV